MFDRLTLMKQHVIKCDELEGDDIPVLDRGRNIFSWRDNLGRINAEEELLRIFPSFTKTFNEPSFDLPCGWNKLVS